MLECFPNVIFEKLYYIFLVVTYTINHVKIHLFQCSFYTHTVKSTHVYICYI